MSEPSGRTSRLSSRFKAAFVALLTVFAIGAVATTSASASPQLNLQFSDGWIRVPSIDAVGDAGTGTFHALDPQAEPALTVGLSGSLDADGNFLSPAAAFDFPTQVIPVTGDFAALIGNVHLEIAAAQDIIGNYDRSTGAFSADLPLTLTVRTLDGLLKVNCRISPLNIALSTSGTTDFLIANDGPGNLSGAPFSSGTGSVLGGWSGVTVDDVYGIDGTTTEMCVGIVDGYLLTGDIDTFDGSMWLSGTGVVTGDPVVKPGPEDEFDISKVAVAGAKKIKAGKKLKLKVKITNSGNADAAIKVKLKSSNKQVKVPKQIKVNVAAGKTVTKKITVKAGKRAKGKAVIKASYGSKTGKAKLKVLAQKKKKKKSRR